MSEITFWLDYYSICLDPLFLLDLIPVSLFVAVQLFYNSLPGCAISRSTILVHLWWSSLQSPGSCGHFECVPASFLMVCCGNVSCDDSALDHTCEVSFPFRSVPFLSVPFLSFCSFSHLKTGATPQPFWMETTHYDVGKTEFLVTSLCLLIKSLFLTHLQDIMNAFANIFAIKLCTAMEHLKYLLFNIEQMYFVNHGKCIICKSW